MANEQSDNQDLGSSSGKKPADGMSTKDRLLAARRAAAEGGGASPSAPPVPAARPAGSAAPRPATPVAAAKSLAQPASDSTATAKRPMKLAASKEEERAARRGKKPVSEEVRREVDMLRKQQDKWITYGWIVAVVLLLIAGVTYFIVNAKKTAMDDIEKARVENVRTFLVDVDKCDIETLPGIEQLVKLTTDPANDPRWKTETLNARAIVSQKVGRAVSNKERIRVNTELLNGIVTLEEFARGASSKSSDELAKGKRRVLEYENQIDLGLDNLQRVAKARMEIDRAYASKLHDEAKAAAGKGPSEARAALAFYTKAEDEITRLLDESVKGSKKNKEMQDYFQPIYQEMIVEADAIVAQVFTPEVIDKTPWTELLSGEQAAKWQHPGFAGWQIKDGVLLANTDLGSKSTAIMSIGDAEKWRDFVWECEFTLVKGEATFHFRLGSAVTNAVDSVTMSTTGSTAFRAGTPNLFTYSVVGSKVRQAFADPDRSALEMDLSTLKTRKGGIGISVPAGSEIKLAKMRIKVLR